MKSGEGEEQVRLAGGGEPAPRRARGLFHSTRLFMIVFLGGWVMQGMFFTYFVSVITTIEKLFRIESKTTGTLLAATEIGQIFTALLLTYAAGRGHRPRWIAASMLVLALGVAGCVLPHLAYGSRLLDTHLEAHAPAAPALCRANATADAGACARQLRQSEIRSVVLPWLFVCLLVVGVGQTGIATLGIPYIDDNVASRHSPLYMAITIGIRVIGPALGFLLGALCTGVYLHPLHPPHFGAEDPRWVGAWWLGMVLVAGAIVVLALLMLCFPRQIRYSPPPPPPPAQLPAPDTQQHSPVKPAPHVLKDFFSTIKRQLTNDILMCRTASSVLHLVPISGLYSFLPKYIETQFHLPPYEANLVSGLGGILVMGLGIVVSGLVILRLVPTARQVAAWTATTALLYSTGMVVLMFVSCGENSLGGVWGVDGGGGGAGAGVELLPCAASCHCDKISPVCGQDGVTYVSACHAGCRAGPAGNATFYNCSCIDPAPHHHTLLQHRWESGWGGAGGGATEGACGAKCPQLYVFLAVFALIMFVHASGEVGSVLLIIRCTDPGDKAMAMGVIQFAIGFFGNVPCPVVFGAVVDAACYLRDAACGAPGACALYDTNNFRHYFLGLTSGIMLLGFVMDVLVWHKAARIQINPDDDAPDPEPREPPHTDTRV